MESTTTNEPRIYNVFETNVPKMNERIGKLNKRAAKLGVQPVVITEVGHEVYKEVYSFDRTEFNKPFRFVKPDYTLQGGEQFTGKVTKRFQFTVAGVTPKLAGWTFIGKIEVVTDESGKVIGNLLRLVPDETAPESYRNTNPWCDHCKVNRHWHETFIIRHENGEHKQVGRRCIADFLGGVSPEAIMGSAEYILAVDDIMGGSEDEDWGGGSGRVQESYDAEFLLRATACHVRIDGWVSKGKAAMNFGMSSTAGNIQSQINARTPKEHKAWEKHVVTEGDIKVAEETAQWLESISPYETNEYLYSLSLLSRAGTIRSNQMGLLCSAVAAMLRAKEQEINRRLKADKHAQSTFVGEVKKRMVFNCLTVELIKYIEGQFGTTTLYMFVDAGGNMVKWFSSNGLSVDGKEVEVGQTLNLKATVKAHETYKEIKQTLISRAVPVA